MTCLLLCEHMYTLLAEQNFSLDLCAFVVLKNLTFSNVLVKVVCKSLFLPDWLQVFLKLLICGFSRY